NAPRTAEPISLMNQMTATVTRILLTTALLFGGRTGLAAQEASDPRAVRDTLEGTWEGEYEGRRAPVFVTLNLRLDATGWTGDAAILGRTIPVHDVVPDDGGVTVVL